MAILLFALLSGAPALLYEVVWTREFALLAGGQVESISLVLVVYFGGLALGSRLLGPLADRAASPLRLYGVLEIGAGLAAGCTPFAIRALAEIPGLMARPALALLAAAVLILPVTLLLGGTLPALLRAALPPGQVAAGRAGLLVGVNTLGALAGIAAAVAGIPTLGLLVSLQVAAAVAVVLGVLAWILGGRSPARIPRETATPRRSPTRVGVLVAAASAGVATLGYEVLAARMAALTLGSSLYAWAAVLFLFLTGLAVGNLCSARRAAGSDDPARDLGFVEVGAALAIACGLLGMAPDLHEPAAGLTRSGLIGLAVGSLPPALLMGAAFPFFVRLSVEGAATGAKFGAVSAANTAGGVVGALAAPFVLLPLMGMVNGALACAALNLAIGAAFLSRRVGAFRLAFVGATALGVLYAVGIGAAGESGPGGSRSIFESHGRQATVAVVRTPIRRDLLVDGDPEASTAGSARATEELLASIPLILHPDPRTLLEIGLGSGITLGTAARFPLERLDCVEIVPGVIEASAFFAPDNGAPASGRDDRIDIVRGDGRAFLAAGGIDYDVIVANTLHPWSVGATGLYSREYFGRIAARLAPGGIAAQWVPIGPIGAEHLAAILRTFFDAFAYGGVWWGAENVIVLGSLDGLPRPNPQRIAGLPAAAREILSRRGITEPGALLARRIATADEVRDTLGPGVILRDDRPVLETSGLFARASSESSETRGAISILERLVEAGPSDDPKRGTLRLFIASQVKRDLGRDSEADELEKIAAADGLELALEARARRLVRRGGEALVAGEIEAAGSAYDRVLEGRPMNVAALFGAAAVKFRMGRKQAAQTDLEALVRTHPEHAGAWSLLGSIRAAEGDLRGARAAYSAALDADPFLPEALANSGLLALEVGDAEAAAIRLRSLRAIDPGESWPETIALARAVAQMTGRR